jgi:hypothetical protein
MAIFCLKFAKNSYLVALWAPLQGHNFSPHHYDTKTYLS